MLPTGFEMLQDSLETFRMLQDHSGFFRIIQDSSGFFGRVLGCLEMLWDAPNWV